MAVNILTQRFGIAPAPPKLETYNRLGHSTYRFGYSRSLFL